MLFCIKNVQISQNNLSIISTAIKLIKYNLTGESKFEITGNKGNNKITELRTVLQRESQNS